MLVFGYFFVSLYTVFINIKKSKQIVKEERDLRKKIGCKPISRKKKWKKKRRIN